MSANFNRVILLGNLTKDVELRHTPNGTPVCDLGLAINRVWSDEAGARQEEVTFVDVTLWKRQAEIAAQYLWKGQPVMIEGRLQLDTWEKDGQKHSKLKVVGERFQLLGSKSEGSTPEPKSTSSPNPPPVKSAAAAAIAPSRRQSQADFDEEPDDIPFLSRVCRDAQIWRGRRRISL